MTVCAVIPHMPTTHVGSMFGWRMGRTGQHQTFHAGWDIVGRLGDPIHSPVVGIVTHVQPNDVIPGSGPFNGYGRVVVVKEPLSQASLMFAHQSRTNVQVGDHVGKGQVLGFVGNANNGRFPGMGAHLHFEIRGNPLSKASAQDPQRWLAYLGWQRTPRNDILSDTACADPSLASKQIGSPPSIDNDVPSDADTDYEPPQTVFQKIGPSPLLVGSVGLLILVGLGSFIYFGRRR